ASSGASSGMGVVNARELTCLTSPIMDVRVCAPQRGGLLVNLVVKEMDEVAEGDLIAQLDDRMVRKSMEAAEARVKAAEEEAAKDISIRYAQEARASADKNLEYSRDANNRIPNSIAPYEMRRYELKCKETSLQIEQAEYEQEIAKLKLDVARAEAAAAAIEVDIRQVRATTSGIITERYRNEGEWLQPGMPIVRLVRMDQLYVRGHVPASLYEPYELQGRPVRIRLRLSRGRERELESTICFSSPLVDTDGTFLVQAVVPNVREDDQWLLRPGMEAAMTLPDV
ncbi:MAG: HlyD family efflux transporter periplasmic adaptor subunit, partial [Planctomycetia bacterium]|nr:HlyD family efflux transporter periplasmic adaptor subunit [Planctomycetia bacterium]